MLCNNKDTLAEEHWEKARFKPAKFFSGPPGIDTRLTLSWLCEWARSSTIGTCQTQNDVKNSLFNIE